MTTPLDIGTQLLVVMLLDELIDAIGRRDGDAVRSAIEHIDVVAGRQIADRIVRELLLIGLASLGTTENGGDAR